MDIVLNTTFNNPNLPVVPKPGLVDEFDGPEGPLGSTLDGKPWTLYMNVESTAFIRTGNGTAGFSGNGGNDSVAVADALTPNGRLTSRILNVNPENTQTGLCARFVDEDTYLWISGGSAGGPLRIYESTRSGKNMLGNSSHVPSDGDDIEVVLNGASVTVYANGSEVTSANTALTSGTLHGLHVRGINGPITTEWERIQFTPAT